jgi:putative ABC transport system substrate-binding protein
MQPRANPYRRAGERFAKTLYLKGVQLAVLKAGTEGEIDAAFASLVQLQAGALVDPDGFLSGRREQLVAPASRQAVPAIYADRQFVAAGGLFIRHIAAALMPTGP